MCYRLLVVLIVGFWLWMMGLLVRSESGRDNQQLISVPVSYVWRLIFRHEEMSSLVLYHGQSRLGTLNLQPRKQGSGASETHQLTASGSFALAIPQLRDQRLVLHAIFDLDRREEMTHIEVAVGLHHPKGNLPNDTFRFDGSPVSGEWHYAFCHGNAVAKENTGKWTQLLDDPDLAAFGINPQVISELSRQQAASTAITARHGMLHVNGEEAETYLVTIRQVVGLETTIHLNQLGQILAVQTPLGYDLYDEAYLP